MAARKSRRVRLSSRAKRRRRSFLPRIEQLESRYVLSTISFVGELGSAAQFNKNETSLDMFTTAPVEVGNSVILEFASKPTSKQTSPPPTISATAFGPGEQVSFQLDANVLNPDPGGGKGGAVQTVILSLHDIAEELPVGTKFTVTFPSSDAQAVTAAEFSGLAVTTDLDGNGNFALDRVSTNIGPSSAPVTSGSTQTTRFAHELLIGAIGVRGQVDAAAPDDATNNLGFTAGAGYTVWTGNGTPSGNKGNKNSSIHPEYQRVSSMGSFEADGILNSNAGGPWAAAIATYIADPTSHFGITAGPDADPNTPGVQIDAGSPFTLVVSALDDNEQLSTGFRGTVHFTVTDEITGELLPVDYKFTTADAGVHTFTNESTLFKSGSRIITVAETPDDPTITEGQVEVFIVAPTFTINDASAEESDGSMTFTVSLDRPISIPVTVDVDFADVTASGAGVDYSSLTQQVVFPANDTTPRTVSVPITDDTIVEGAETFTAQLSTNTDLGGLFVDLTDTGTGTILDTSDAASVSIVATDAAASEPNNNGLFTVSLSAESSTPTAVAYSVTGTAAPGGDYVALSGTVTIPANTISAVIPVTVVDDSLVEGDETVIVTLDSVSGDPQIGVGAPASDVVTIADDTDTAVVSITATDDASEPADNGLFTVSLSEQSSTPTDISYTVSGTASPGADYSILNGTVTIPALTSSATIPVIVANDEDVEGDETVVVTLNTVTSGDPQISVGAPASDAVTIHDDDTTTVSITASDATADESPTNPGQFTVTMANGKVAPVGGVLVTYSVAGTATPTSDYAALSGTVLISAGSGSATIEVSGIVDDNLIEADESVIATLLSTDHAGVTVGAPDSATVTILDNDTATFTIDDVTVDEGAGTLDFTLSLDNPIDAAADVNVSFADVTTSAGDLDHTTQKISFAALDTADKTVSVPITDDDIVELTESFTASLTIDAGTPLGARTVDTSDSGTGTITDNDTATFTINNVTVDEGAGTLGFTLSLNNLIDAAADVNVSFADVTTNAGDFDHTTQKISFAALDNADKTVSVPVTDDDIVELTESFTANLTIDAGTPLGARGVDTSDAGTGTITDNDTATFTINDVTVDEGVGNATFTISLDNELDAPVSINVNYGGGTALGGGGDYDSASDTVNFAAGDNANKTVTVAIVDDSVLEGPETFNASLSLNPSPSIGSRSVDLSDTGIGTILDNDATTVSIAANDPDASESGSDAGQFTVTLDGGVTSSVPILVSYNTGGTAGSADYTPLSGSVTISANSPSAVIDVTGIVDDALVEFPETVIVTLTSTNHAGVSVNNTGDTATVTIADNDSATLSINDVSETEGDAGSKTFGFEVTLSAAVDGGVSFDYATSDGSATVTDGDYAGIGTTTRSFAGTAAGATEVIHVTVNGDTKVEEDQGFNVLLSNIQASGLDVSFADATGVGTIVNDDAAVVTIVANDPDAAEPDDNGQFTVSMTLASETDTVVGFLVGGTATEGDDYASLTPHQVTIAAGAISATIDVIVLTDTTAENDETVVITLDSIVGGVTSAISVGQPSSATVTIEDPGIQILDNNPTNPGGFPVENDPRFTSNNFFNLQTNGGYAGDYLIGGGLGGVDFAQWKFDLLMTGTYRVSVSWNTLVSPRDRDAWFRVFDGDENSSTVYDDYVDQEPAPNPDVTESGIAFQDLGVFNITQNQLTVRLQEDTVGPREGFMIADAVRIELLLALEGDAGAAMPASNPQPLTDADVAPLHRGAVEVWRSEGAADIGQLDNVQYKIADLPDNVLGLASRSTGMVWLDRTGAGYGWQVDARSQGGFDPLTVIVHELGHLVGEDHADEHEHEHEHVMAERLTLSPEAGASSTLASILSPAFANRPLATALRLPFDASRYDENELLEPLARKTLEPVVLPLLAADAVLEELFSAYGEEGEREEPVDRDLVLGELADLRFDPLSGNPRGSLR